MNIKCKNDNKKIQIYQMIKSDYYRFGLVSLFNAISTFMG